VAEFSESSTFELDEAEEEHFTQVPNALLRNRTISPEARWLASWLMSHRRGFKVSMGAIIHAANCGKDRAYRMVRELIAAGYIRRVAERDQATGQFIQYRYVVRKRPVTGNPEAGEPEAGNPPHKNTSNHRTPPGEGGSSSSTAVSKQAKEITDGMRRLCDLLADHVEQMTGKRPPTITQDWLVACRRLIALDGATEEQVEWVIRWVGQDDFWDSNILSMPTLRKQWPKLVAAIKSERRRTARPRRQQFTTNGGHRLDFDQWNQLGPAMAAYFDQEGHQHGHDGDGMGGVREAMERPLPAPADPA
jgi:hypothetical protein